MQKKIEELIIENTMIGLNQVFGNNKSSFLGITLMQNLPIDITLHYDDLVTAPTTAKELIHNNLAAWVDQTEASVNLMFTISKDNEEELFDFIESNTDIITYLFLHECLHLLNRDTKQSNHNMHLKVVDDARMVNIAMDYRINLVVSDLMKKAKLSTELDNVGMYDKKYEDMTSIEILHDLKENGQMDSQDNEDGSVTITMDNGDDTGTIRTKDLEPVNGDSDSEIEGESAQEIEGKMQAVANRIADVLSKQAGSESQEIMGQELLKIKVDSSWFKSLDKSLSNKLYLATAGSRSTWSQLNNTYRHLFKAPASYKRKKTIPRLILFIDQSGSVDDNSLGKLIDIIDTNKKKIAVIELHIFDTEIVSSCITENKSEMVKFISTRRACGGTSLDPCFEYLENMKRKDLSESVVMFVSDFYCDHPVPKILNKTTSYMIHTNNHEDVSNVYKSSTCIYM